MTAQLQDCPSLQELLGLEQVPHFTTLQKVASRLLKSALAKKLLGATSNLARSPRKLLDQVRDVLRVKHYAYRTEQAYVHWIKRFILFHGKMPVSKCPMRA